MLWSWWPQAPVLLERSPPLLRDTVPRKLNQANLLITPYIVITEIPQITALGTILEES